MALRDHDEAREARIEVERGIKEGRYVQDTLESLREEEEAKKNMTWSELLKWRLQMIRNSRNSNMEVLRKPTSTSSSSRHREREEEPIQEPPQEERLGEEVEVPAEDPKEEEIVRCEEAKEQEVKFETTRKQKEKDSFEHITIGTMNAPKKIWKEQNKPISKGKGDTKKP